MTLRFTGISKSYIQSTFVAVFLSAFIVSCESLQISTKVPTLPSIDNPIETPTLFPFGNPVENEIQALEAAASGPMMAFSLSQPITAVKVMKTSLDEASRLTQSGTSGESASSTVWLVVYYSDKWEAIADVSGQAPFLPFQGCVFVIVNANDDRLLIMSRLQNNDSISECKN